MALEDIVMMASDNSEPITDFPLGTLNQPKDQLVEESTVNELTLVLEASFSS